MPCGPRASPGGAPGAAGPGGGPAAPEPLHLGPLRRQSGRGGLGVLKGTQCDCPACRRCRAQISTESFLHLRYQGTDCALMVSAHQHLATAHSPRAGDFGAGFVERYVSSASWEPCLASAGLAARPDGSPGPPGVQVHEGVWLHHP